MKFIALKTCNGGAKGRDTYGRERMYKALLLKYPDSGIPSEATVYRVMTAIGITHRPNRMESRRRTAKRESQTTC